MTNLTTLCISTEKMLKNFSPMPTLKEVRILAFSQVKNCYSLEEFFKKNTQLKKIEFARGLNDKILQIILSYKYLNYLYIDGTSHLLLGNESYVPNYTIKKLFLGLIICGERAIKIINACQNLEILIFESVGSEELGTMRWNELNQRLKF
ncbi:hypothetical protein CONCODRAFT_11343 [Conidiobolus coronatus NRRL 28638]|uniref:F-box domain-containing protein n=1 Tax=Conidiobolus coronatus (strain ATCC 28846 / CBS 209.66 / NRRL 28638) TaxID=796925 RepID=A0A137NVV0_CONC2|nr:hypothetical protein CONCODRAFT_11343 [Conidiobolus coronatus NRRL 28638]|eukprot:KXN66734.1 hypothetical protein CONCODRAFT_11343 [Conidiobolus coronatus NRRL 28638]